MLCINLKLIPGSFKSNAMVFNKEAKCFLFRWGSDFASVEEFWESCPQVMAGWSNRSTDGSLCVG